MEKRELEGYVANEAVNIEIVNNQLKSLLKQGKISNVEEFKYLSISVMELAGTMVQINELFEDQEQGEKTGFKPSHSFEYVLGFFIANKKDPEMWGLVKRTKERINQIKTDLELQDFLIDCETVLKQNSKMLLNVGIALYYVRQRGISTDWLDDWINNQPRFWREKERILGVIKKKVDYSPN